MADEIAQVCQLEVQGITLVVKGTVEAAQMILRMMRALINFVQNENEKSKEKKLNLQGKKEPGDIMKMSEGPAPVIDIREDVLEEVLSIASQDGLHFARPMDFNPYDKMCPIMIPAQEAAVWGAILKTVLARKMEEDKDVVENYAKQISEDKEKLLHASPEEKKAIETKIENFSQAKEEAEKWVSYDENMINNENVTMSLTDYLRQSKGTEFETNPEKAMAEYDKGVELGKKITAKECFQPIRDKSYITDTQLMFYVPEIGSVVTRRFMVDKETGLVFSKYALKNEKGEVYQFTDYNMTKEQWNTEVLPDMLDKANLIEGTECRLFDSQEKLTSYMKYHNQVKSPVEIEIEKDLKEGKQVFSSAEVRKEVENAVSERHKGLASAAIKNNHVTIAAEPNALFRQGGKLSLRLESGETLLIGSMKNERMEKGKAVFEINADDTVLMMDKNAKDLSQVHQITGSECKELIAKAAMSAQMQNEIRKQTSHR